MSKSPRLNKYQKRAVDALNKARYFDIAIQVAKKWGVGSNVSIIGLDIPETLKKLIIAGNRW